MEQTFNEGSGNEVGRSRTSLRSRQGHLLREVLLGTAYRTITSLERVVLEENPPSSRKRSRHDTPEPITLTSVRRYISWYPLCAKLPFWHL
jgi:hypothetical protein